MKRSTYHAGAGENVPTQSNTIAILDLAPLLLERLVIHGGRMRQTVDAG